jgi:hypothetical protein
MNKTFLIVAVIILITYRASAQECNCLESFNWMIYTFENNDAGFRYVIDKKGVEDYKQFTASLKEKAIGISKLNGCQELMSDWLKYFRSGHIGVFVKDTIDDTKQPSDAAIRLQYKNEKTIDMTEKSLIAALEKKQNKNPIEGIWSDGNYTLGIIGNENSDEKFTAFIIKADSVYWIPKQIKAELTLHDDNKTFGVDYYMRNHSKETTSAMFTNDSSSLLLMKNNYWKRIYPKSSMTKKEELMLLFSTSKLPFVERLSDKTLYLRIPSFEAEQKHFIDSTMSKNDNLITSTPNLIIDIRNGTGGSDASYEEIIKYLYTNPIREMGVQLLATELNAKAYEKYSKQYDDSSRINHCLNVAKKMRKNIGKFITMDTNTFDMDTFPKIFPFPKKVAIICNQNNGSTDEQFLIDAKQNTKVKVFGRPTLGTLDISNMNVIDFADNHFVLAYCMSKSFRIPEYCIDGVGIQPDYFIDDAIKDSDWVDYVRILIEQ